MPEVFPAPSQVFVQKGSKKWRLPEPLTDWLEYVMYTSRQILAEEMPWRTPAQREGLVLQALTQAIWGATFDQIRQNLQKSDEWKSHHAN
jgi:hypothetical protein